MRPDLGAHTGRSGVKSVVIGLDAKTREPVRIDQAARARSSYVLGITGAGKSSLLEAMAQEDMQNGDGLLYLDPHGDSAERLLAMVSPERQEEVIFWDPLDLDHPFGLNPFSVSNPEDRLAVARKADSFVAALGSLREFAPIFESAPVMKNVLHHLAIAFVANPGHTLLDAPRFLTDESFRSQFYPRLSHHFKGVFEYWERFDARREHIQMEEIRSTLNKLERFPGNPVIEAIFSRETSVDFREVMDQGRIVIVKLTGSGIEDTAAFVGAFVIWDLLEAARSRSDLAEEERRPFHVFADEFQTYMTTAFPTILEQARKFGLDLCVAHQIREQLDDTLRDRVRGVGNLIVFRVTGANAASLAGEFPILIPEPPTRRLEPKYELVRDLLGHLATRGHRDDYVVAKYQALRLAIDQMVEEALWTMKEQTGRVGGVPEVTAGDYRLVELKTRHLETALNHYLYISMEVPQTLDHKGRTAARGERGYPAGAWALGGVFDSFYRDLFPCFREAQTVRQALAAFFRLGGRYPLEALKANLSTLMLPRDFRTFQEQSKTLLAIAGRNNEAPDPALAQAISILEYRAEEFRRWVFAYYLMRLELQVWDQLEFLGDALWRDPCYGTVGQLQSVPEPRRLYSDVQLEMANALTTLERFHARCKLEAGGTVADFHIVTRKPSAGNYPSSVGEIKWRSWEAYGSSLPISGPSGTIEDDKLYGDDTESAIQFGEKQTALQSSKSRRE